MDRENQLIERVRRRFPSPKGILRVGIGDDAAVLRSSDWLGRAPLQGSKAKDWVITADAFLENVHFLRQTHPPEAVGYKALARATSDIAAMGARGRYFFLTLALPDECTGRWLDGFLDGMARAARRFGLVLAGGDTTKYPLVVSSLTVLGEIEAGRAILRSGARPGDLICVSGRLGEAELGLRLVQRMGATLNDHKPRRAARRDNAAGAGSTWSPRYGRSNTQQHWATLTKKHFYPEPRLALGQWLAANRLATSMIDTSDGLSTDLGHICKASGVGARVWSHKIPAAQIPPGLPRAGGGPATTRSASSKASLPLKASLDPLELALHGGEDYELLFTVPKKLVGRLAKDLGRVPLTVIGEITRSKRILLVDEPGRTGPLQPKGWDPFRTRGRR